MVLKFLYRKDVFLAFGTAVGNRSRVHFIDRKTRYIWEFAKTY